MFCVKSIRMFKMENKVKYMVTDVVKISLAIELYAIKSKAHVFNEQSTA